MAAHLPNPRFRRFWSEVDLQLASLGATDAWSNEVRPYFDDGLSVNETAMAIIEGRENDHALSPWCEDRREHSTLDHRTQGI